MSAWLLSCRERYRGLFSGPWRIVGVPGVSCCHKLHGGPCQQAGHTKGDLWCTLSALWGPQALGLQHPQLGSLYLLQPVWGAGRCQRGLEGCGDQPGGQGSATQHSVCQQCPRRARRWWAAGRGGGWGTGAWSPPRSSWPTRSCWAWS